MQQITFNKLVDSTPCFMCRKNRVPMALWNKPCVDCKKKLLEALKNPPAEAKVEVVKLGKKLPAARIEKEKTRTTAAEDIYVDKYGRKVENPGYDPINDPRGWYATGTIQKKGTLIF